MPESSTFEVAMAFEKLKRHKSPDMDQIPAELIKAVGRTICSEIHEFINSNCDKEELPEQWKQLIIVPIYKKVDKTDCRNLEVYHFCQLHTEFYPTSCWQG